MATDYMRAMLDELMGSGGGNDDGGEGKNILYIILYTVYNTVYYIQLWCLVELTDFIQCRPNSKAEMFAVLFY